MKSEYNFIRSSYKSKFMLEEVWKLVDGAKNRHLKWKHKNLFLLHELESSRFITWDEIHDMVTFCRENIENDQTPLKYRYRWYERYLSIFKRSRRWNMFTSIGDKTVFQFSNVNDAVLFSLRFSK